MYQLTKSWTIFLLKLSKQVNVFAPEDFSAMVKKTGYLTSKFGAKQTFFIQL